MNETTKLPLNKKTKVELLSIARDKINKEKLDVVVSANDSRLKLIDFISDGGCYDVLVPKLKIDPHNSDKLSMKIDPDKIRVVGIEMNRAREVRLRVIHQ